MKNYTFIYIYIFFCFTVLSFSLKFHFGNAFYKFTWSGLTDCIFVLVEDRQPHYSIHRGSLTDRCIFHVPTCARVSVCVCECGCVCVCACMYAFVCDDFLLFPYYFFFQTHPPPLFLPPLCVCVVFPLSLPTRFESSSTPPTSPSLPVLFWSLLSGH